MIGFSAAYLFFSYLVFFIKESRLVPFQRKDEKLDYGIRDISKVIDNVSRNISEKETMNSFVLEESQKSLIKKELSRLNKEIPVLVEEYERLKAKYDKMMSKKRAEEAKKKKRRNSSSGYSAGYSSSSDWSSSSSSSSSSWDSGSSWSGGGGDFSGGGSSGDW